MGVAGGLHQIAKELGRGWRATAKVGGADLLRAPVQRSTSIADIVARHGGTSNPLTSGSISHKIPSKTGGAPMGIVEHRTQGVEPGSLDDIFQLDENVGADYHFSPQEIALMEARAAREGKTGWSALNTMGIPSSSGGAGGAFYRDLYDALPSMETQRVMGYLTPNNVSAQSERMFDQLIRNMAAGDLADPFRGMTMANQMGYYRGVPPHLRAMIGMDDADRFMPSTLMEPGQLRAPEQGYAESFELLRDSDPDALLGYMALNRMGNTMRSLPGLEAAADIPLSRRMGALQSMQNAVREGASKELRIPGTGATFKDLVTYDALRAMQRGDDPLDVFGDASPYLEKQFARGGAVHG